MMPGIREGTIMVNDKVRENAARGAADMPRVVPAPVARRGRLQVDQLLPAEGDVPALARHRLVIDLQQ